VAELTPADDPNAELTPGDVESYTQGRLLASAQETAKILSRALAAARRYCGWVVTPPATDVDVVLDGPGTRDLVLPTMNLTALTACVEDGVTIDPTDLVWSRQGIVRKRNGCRWSCQYGAIRLTVTHGYSTDEADDWRGAVLAACDLAAQNVGPLLQQYRVDDVIRQWFKPGGFALDKAILDPYKLMGVA
jgi:hypothetical protein